MGWEPDEYSQELPRKELLGGTNPPVFKQTLTEGVGKFDRVKYQREYMRKWRAKKKVCPHCGKEIK